MPEEWLEADIKQGLTTAQVEERRRRCGFNEISTEKENLFIKFLMFFTGPILYGKSIRIRMLYDDFEAWRARAMACSRPCHFSPSATLSLEL